MDNVLPAIQAALNWVNDPVHKTVLAMIGGWILNRWPAFINKAIPAVVTAGSILLGVGQLAFAATGAFDAHPANFIAAVAAEAGKPSVGSAILDAVVGTILPVWVATGHYSWGKNLVQWLALGLPLFVKKK